MSSHRPTVLILAGDPAFAREITAHWPEDSHSAGPEFTVLDPGFSHDLERDNYDLTIADASAGKKNKDKDLKQSLAASAKPAILIHSHPSRDFYRIDGTVLELRRDPGVWPAMASLIGCEILRRRQAESCAHEAEKFCAAAQAEATLGRYMLEMRTNINNALTTVLGNAELMVLEPGLPATVLAQADTIRNMALRLNEVFQRFSSIEKELSVADRELGKKTVRAAAGGN